MREPHLKGARESSSLKEESKAEMGGYGGSSRGLEEEWLEAKHLPANVESKQLELLGLEKDELRAQIARVKDRRTA